MPLTLTIEFQHAGYQNYPAELNPELSNDCFVANCIANMAWDLDCIIDSPGVRPISELMDDSEMLSYEEWEDMGLPPPAKKWIRAPDALSTFLALNGALERRSPNEEIEGCRVADALEEMRVMIAILRRADESGECVRFSVAD